MDRKSITKNYIYNLMYQILVILVPLITTPYLSRVLGAEKIGIYSYTISVATYFILFGSLGVAMYGQREIAYVQNDKYLRSKNFYEILIMRSITLGISLVVFYFTFALNGEYSVYYKILMLEILANGIDISWFFQGLEEFKKTVIRNAIVKIASAILIFILVKSQNDLIKYFFIYVMSNLLGNITLWISLPKFVQKVDIKELNYFKHFKPTLSLFIPQIAVQIYTVLDKTMIGAIIEDKSEVGFYEQAQKIVKILLAIVTALGTVMVPRMASTFAKGDTNKIIEYMNKSFKFVLFLAIPLMFGLISISNKFVPIFYGQGYEKVVYLINISSPIIIFIGLSNAIGTQYLLPTKMQKEFTISVTIGASINFILNTILIKYYYSVGASIATVFAEMMVTSIQFYLVRDVFKIKDILRISRKYFVASVAMFVVSIGISIAIKSNVLSILIQVCSGCIIYFVILIILKDELVLEGIKKLKLLMKKDKALD